MQTLFSRLGAVRCLFFKSEQFQLIEMPVQVGASVDKRGHFTQAHTRIQKVRIEKPAQPDLFGNSEEPQKDKHSARLEAFIIKHGGLGSLAHLMSGMTDGQQQRIFEEMGKLGGKSVVEVAAMFDNIKPEPAPQADLFAAPQKHVDEIDTSEKHVEKKAENEHVAPSHAGDIVVPHAIVGHITGRGKTLRGIVRTDLTKDQAMEIDQYTFKKNGGWFIREKHLKPGEVAISKPVTAENPQKTVAKESKSRYERLLERRTDGTPDEMAAEDARISNLASVQVGNVDASLPFGVQAGISKQARRDLNTQAAAIVARGGEYSDEDKAILRQYSGNGGCGDSLNEFYTLPEVASAMWLVAQRLGVKGEVLEPSCGPGVFLHTAPADSKVTGVEMDETSAKIAKALHGDRHEIANASLERFATQDERQYDGVLGNVPFGLRGSLIKDDKPNLKTADAYFCDTAMDKCKSGGIVGLIVPTGIMDSRTNRKLREALLRKGQFLGAQRMPNTAFEHSHTEVTTDVVWFRKFPDDVAGALSSSAVKQDHLKALGVWDEEFLAGKYFTGRGAENVLGKMGDGWRAKAGMGADITVEGSMSGVPEALAEFSPEDGKEIPAVTDILTAVGGDEKARSMVMGGAMNRPYADTSKVGDTKTVDGVVYVLQGNPPRWHRIDEVLQSEALKQGQDIAARIDALMDGMTAVDRSALEKDLREWVEAHGIPSKNKDVLLGAQQDKVLYRLIGAVKSNGELSDAVTGKVAKQQMGSFEATVQSLLNDHETVGVDRLAKAAELDREEALDQLYGSPKYAIDPVTGEWTTKDIYLSGDLWAKADFAKAALSGEGLAPELRKKLEQQVTMLTETIAPVSLEDAFIQVNSAFLPTSILSAFLTSRNQNGNKWQKELPPVVVTFEDGVYAITGGNGYGEQSHLDKYLNRTGLRKDDKHIIDDLNVEFKDWLCASPEYREIAEDLYNRKFRGFAEREFSNEPMDIPGMNTEGLKDYQWGGLRWALNAGKGIIAADVGLGKTARALMLARTLKTTGQAKRPMIVVPKSVLANWFDECEKWFPGSKVLTIGGSFERLADGSLKGKDDNAAERKRKYHDLQQNEYDFIICSEPSFEEIDLDPITKGEYNSKDFWVQRGDKLGNAGDKRAKQIRESWEQARASQEFGKDSRTDATYFNGLGVDALIHDEFHHQKNLCAIKSRFGESPKYLGGGGLSMRALDFNLKARWLLDQQNGKNVYGLTATPTKNSPIEIYAMLSHVAPEAFEKIGVRNSEEFLDRFAKFENGMALDTGGKMEEALITAGFQNMDELRAIMKRYIHRQTADEVGLKLPGRQDVTHMVTMDAEQESAYSELRELAAEAKGKDATGDAHIFSIMDKMNKAAVDLSLLDPDYDGTKSPKYITCAQEIIKNMKDGGQIVFSDYVDSHEKIAAALVASGIPRNQIGIINAQVASSSSKRQSICDAFNARKLKVVIGNTATMGEGLNLQKGTSDIHHLDLPWEPASMQQRNGRGLRQGNTNEGVRVHAYLAKGSFDGYRLQAILAKKDWQDAVWKGGNEVENMNQQGNVSRDEMMIMLAADPDQAREAFEANHKAKEERLVAGRTAEASQRFVKFQEVKRSYASLKNKDTQSAARLKAKLDKEYSALKADKYFTAKQALDSDTPVIVASTGTMMYAGAGIEVTDGDKVARYVVEGVDPRKQQVAMRLYGQEMPVRMTMDIKDMPKPKAFAYDEKAETEEISRKIAEKPLEIKQVSDVMKLPPSVISANHDKLQSQLWDGLRNYKVSAGHGSVALIDKVTGQPVIVPSHEVSGNSKGYGPDTHDFMLPTEENKQKAIQAWMDAERAASFGTDTASVGRRGGKTVTRAKRKYGFGVDGNNNPWTRIIGDLSGKYSGGGYYYGDGDSPEVKPIRQKLIAEQNERIRHAKTFSEALDAAAPLGEIQDADKGYGARVKLPKKAIAALWAKARHLDVLGGAIDTHEPKSESYGGKYGKHSNYFLGDKAKSVHAAILGLAASAGHDDLVHAMVESGLRHHKDGKHEEALQAIANGYEHRPARIRAMQKLAGAAGLLDKKRGDIQGYGNLSASQGYYSSQEDKSQTVGDRLNELLAASQKIYDKEPA
ncbi:MAG TPA: SNF2-related protein [Gallionellaceae bacterium]|jgi:superfamily II DNA or RNA helicase|nr:SNF2-related protein [Gallionellaceae bacterium]